MTEIRIPVTLRALTAGEKKVCIQAEEETFESVLDALEAKHLGFKERLLDEQGELVRHINVFRNSDDIRFLGGLAAAVTASDEVSIIPAIVGGDY